MFSARFQLAVFITRHARLRMLEREVDEALLSVLIETGKMLSKDEAHIWLYKQIEGRSDNLLCVAAVIEDQLIVKTVMHRFQLESPR